MSNAGSHQWQTKRDVHSPMHAEEFDRNVALIVVLRYDAVEVTATGPQKKRVGREGAAHIDSGGGQLCDGWGNQTRLFIAKQSRFAAVRIQGSDCNPRSPPQDRRQQ